MGRFPQKSDGKGSMRVIQTLVNDYPQVFQNHLDNMNPELGHVEWISPLREDSMAEYRDKAFLERLGRM